MGERRHAQANGIRAAFKACSLRKIGVPAHNQFAGRGRHISRATIIKICPKKANPAIRARSANLQYQSCHPVGVREQARKRPAIRAATNYPFRASFSRP